MPASVRRSVPPRYRSPLRRRLRVAILAGRRVRRGIERRAALFTGWVWVAAISFVGVEMFEVVFGTLLLAPEFLPVVLLGLAAAWYFRESLRTAARRVLGRTRRLRGGRRR